MYAADMRSFCNDVEKSLCELEYFLTNLEMAAVAAEPAKSAAFHINKIRGAAELRQIPWLAEVAAQFERGMHTVAEHDKKVPLKNVVDVHFRAIDAIRNFVVGLQDGVEDVDDDLLGLLEQCTKVFGTFGDEASQDQIDQQLGDLLNPSAASPEAAPVVEAAPEPVPEPVVTKPVPVPTPVVAETPAPVARPAPPAMSATAPEPEEGVDLSILQGKKVLVVDDDVIIRNILCNYVRSQGMEASQAEDGRAGFRQLRMSGSGYDIAIVDLHMPRMDGFQLVAAVRKEEKIKDMNLLIFTASLHMSDVHKAISLGVQGYLLKRQWKGRILNEMAKILHKSHGQKEA